MRKVCPKCNSSNVANVVYGLYEHGGVPEGCVAGGCAVDPCIKWRCQSCGFDWGPVDCLRDLANNLEEEYWRGAESCLSLKEVGKNNSTHLSKIKKKILDRKELTFDEVEMIEFDISTCSIDMAMQANKYVRDEYEKQLAQVREGKIIDVDEETLKRRYEKPSNISKLWEAMTDSERSAVNSFRVYYPERVMAMAKELRYKVKILEDGQTK